MQSPRFQDNHYIYDDFFVGQTQDFSIKIDESSISKFAALTGDRNPIHISKEAAKQSIFKAQVAHGFFIASFFSSMYAHLLPGPGSIILEQNLKFLNPVFINDRVLYQLKIIALHPEKKTIEIESECSCDEKKIINGKSTLLFTRS
jgi:3-hydroxybutyryl-CoA dehydratase